MKRTWLTVMTLAALTLGASVAIGDDGARLAIGFRDTEAPLGFRLWFNKAVGVDGDFGFFMQRLNVDFPGEIKKQTFSGFKVDLGVPISLRSWDRVSLIARPGIAYKSQDNIEIFIDTTDPGPPVREKINTFVASAEVEIEAFVMDRLSVSASQGFGLESQKVGDANADLTFSSVGQNFTAIGLHLYLWP